MVTVWESGTFKAELMALHVYCSKWSVGFRMKVYFTTLVLPTMRLLPLFSNNNTSLGWPLLTVHFSVNSSPSVPWIVPWFCIFSIVRFVGGSINKKKHMYFIYSVYKYRTINFIVFVQIKINLTVIMWNTWIHLKHD